MRTLAQRYENQMPLKGIVQTQSCYRESDRGVLAIVVFLVKSRGRGELALLFLLEVTRPEASHRCFASLNVVRISRDRSMSCFDLSSNCSQRSLMSSLSSLCMLAEWLGRLTTKKRNSVRSQKHSLRSPALQGRNTFAECTGLSMRQNLRDH